MTRVTPSEVTTNFETDLTDPEITGWIETATLLVDDIAAADPTISTTRLEKIELALTRHLASAQDPRVSSETVADAQLNYQGEYGLRLDGTVYGQQASMLDPTDTLDAASKTTKQVGISVPDSRNLDRTDNTERDR